MCLIIDFTLTFKLFTLPYAISIKHTHTHTYTQMHNTQTHPYEPSLNMTSGLNILY